MGLSESKGGKGGVRAILWPRGEPGRWWRLSLLAPIGLVLAALLLYPVVEAPTRLHAENRFIEASQAALWVGCILLAGVLGWRTRGLTRGAVLWRGVIAVPALGREFDLQEMLNPEAFGPWGVHYRLDWWMDMSEPLLVKLVWAGVGVIAGLALVLPIIAARPDPKRQLRAGHPAAWLTLVGCVMLAMGWVLDDLMRGMLPKQPAKAGEEFSELIGVGLFLASIVASATQPWTAWRARTGEPADPEPNESDPEA